MERLRRKDLLIFFAVLMFIGYLVKGKAPAKAESAETDSAEQA